MAKMTLAILLRKNSTLNQADVEAFLLKNKEIAEVVITEQTVNSVNSAVYAYNRELFMQITGQNLIVAGDIESQNTAAGIQLHANTLSANMGANVLTGGIPPVVQGGTIVSTQYALQSNEPDYLGAANNAVQRLEDSEIKQGLVEGAAANRGGAPQPVPGAPRLTPEPAKGYQSPTPFSMKPRCTPFGSSSSEE